MATYLIKERRKNNRNNGKGPKRRKLKKTERIKEKVKAL